MQFEEIDTHAHTLSSLDFEVCHFHVEIKSMRVWNYSCWHTFVCEWNSFGDADYTNDQKHSSPLTEKTRQAETLLHFFKFESKPAHTLTLVLLPPSALPEL